MPHRDSSVPHPTREQWYSVTRLQKLTTSEHLDWDNARLEIAQHEPVPEIAYSPYLDNNVFAFLLAGSTLMKARIPDSVARNERVRPGTLHILPRQTVFGASWNAPWTYGVLVLNRERFVATSAAVLRGDPQKTALIPTYFINDPFLYHLGTELTHEMQNHSPHGALYADSLTNRLTLYLLRHFSVSGVVRELPESRLTHVQLSRVD